MRLTAVWVTFSSFAAAVKLPWRPAASNARNPFNEGNRRTIDPLPQSFLRLRVS